MIKLERGERPDFLNEEDSQALTQKYLQEGGSVWNRKDIKEALLQLSNDKCAYCETSVVEESKYMEVEHFRCKDDFPDMIVEWENLLPSCKRCNGRKGRYNVETQGMIVNPFETDPRIHMYFRNYRLRWRDETGRRTIIDSLYLNDTVKLVGTRMKVGEAICTALESLRDDLEDYNNGNQTARKWTKIIRGVERLLLEAQPESPYSALVATVLLTDPDYIWIKNRLSASDDWGPLKILEEKAQDLMLIE